MGKKTEYSKLTYDNMASEYETSLEGRYTRKHKEELLKKVIINNSNTILDVACGNGYLLNELSKKASDIKAIGIDLSGKMIEIAKKNNPNHIFLEQPCCPMVFEDGSIDVITVSCAFHHFEKPEEFTNECLRVLQDNGKIYMAEPYFQPMIRWIANVFVFPFSNKGDVKIYSPKNLEKIFRKAGFTDIKTYINGTVIFFEGRKNKDE